MGKEGEMGEEITERSMKVVSVSVYMFLADELGKYVTEQDFQKDF